MLFASRIKTATVGSAALFLLAVSLWWGSTAAQSPLVGRHTVQAPERTDAGDWEGTWYYVSRIRKMALWFREDDGEIKIRVRVAGAAGKSESFTTDWDGKAEFIQTGKPGSFRLDIDQADANTITGRWNWDYGTPEAGESERAEFTMYRAGYGRQLVWHFTGFEHKYWGSNRPDQRNDVVVWTLQKVSRREALWAELPF